MKHNVFLRVRVKELAQEAKFIRIEEARANKDRDFTLQNRLSEHRTGKLRRAARETILAYQYMRGFPYAAVEQSESKPLKEASIKAVERMVRTYDGTILVWKDWVDGKNHPKAVCVDKAGIPEAPEAAA